MSSSCSTARHRASRITDDSYDQHRPRDGGMVSGGESDRRRDVVKKNARIYPGRHPRVLRSSILNRVRSRSWSLEGDVLHGPRRVRPGASKPHQSSCPALPWTWRRPWRGKVQGVLRRRFRPVGTIASSSPQPSESPRTAASPGSQADGLLGGGEGVGFVGSASRAGAGWVRRRGAGPAIMRRRRRKSAESLPGDDAACSRRGRGAREPLAITRHQLDHLVQAR